jgi:fatty acid amide hydrolase 2
MAELNPTRMSAVALAAAIREGRLTSREVVFAHIEALERAQPRTNAVVADRYELAREEADAADTARKSGAKLGALHGVPCTVKESIALRGMPNAAGLVARKQYRSTETAPAVQRLIDAGAIPLAVTNTSEMTMWIESDNRLYGRTNSAYSEQRTAGGSSGGEGAAIGSGGAPFGIGSDIAGSIRIPAFFNGVFGHKPSADIVPDTGQFPAAEGEAARMLTMGPIARSAEDLMPVLEIIAGPDGVDERTRDFALGDPSEVSLDGLDVVISESTSYFPVSRELRGMREQAAGALAAAGAKVRREPMKSLRRALELYLAALQSGSPTPFHEILASAGVEHLNLRKAWADALRGRGDHTIPTLVTYTTERIGDRIPDAYTRKAVAGARSLEEEFTAILGDGVLLYPPHARVTPKHGRTVGRAWSITPTAAFNLLAVPVTQVPLGLNKDGLPLGVQVVGTDGSDHITIAVALELERVFGGWVPPPDPS